MLLKRMNIQMLKPFVYALIHSPCKQHAFVSILLDHEPHNA